MLTVLDSNIILSAVLFDGVPEKVVRQVLKNKGLVLSPYIIEEVGGVLEKKFKYRQYNVVMLQQLLSQAQIYYFKPFLNIVSDQADNRILETAVIGKADYIVTGDKLLLDLNNYKNTKIVKPADFLRLAQD